MTPQSPLLKSGSVTLRAVTLADAPDIADGCDDSEMARWTTIPTPYGLEDAFAYVECRSGSAADADWARWAIETDGRWSGNISLRSDGDGLAEIGYLVAPWARSRGVASQAAWLVCDWGFGVGLTVIAWHAAVGNIASRRVAEKVGFTVSPGVMRRRMVLRGQRVDIWVGDLLPEDLVARDQILQ